ncbi:MAG: hypothetical protein KME07_22405 [Pegethrix bostrychoides GSE-TBD4-15B]|jgi:hypothetical protein|uniref:Uncharacterized protein n=1 Tax=Pegethrix bostrychoides GSE-TBD4-15B TaxID=2839662 RepID=A0A951PF54_9CYAN|nr:hypothetical protein [Pegethrix bostrychoides GSE-TBD4-15B]
MAEETETAETRKFSGNFQADITFPKVNASPPAKMTARVLVAYDNPTLAAKLDNSVALLVGELDAAGVKPPRLIGTLVAGKEKDQGKQYFHASADYPDEIKLGADVSIKNLSLTFTYSDPADQIEETTFQEILAPKSLIASHEGGGAG